MIRRVSGIAFTARTGALGPKVVMRSSLAAWGSHVNGRRSYASGGAGASPSTYLSMMDSVWNRQWFGTMSSSTGPSEVEEAASFFAESFTTLQSVLGIEAWVAIMLFGACTRLCTLYFSFYGERATARMQLALPELKAPQDTFNRVYYNDSSSSLDVQLAASNLKSERRRVFAKYSTSNAKCLAPLVASPFIMGGLYHVSALCANPALDVGTSSFAWCNALALSDPFYILPLTFCTLTLLNFELSIKKEMKKGWMTNVIWGARLGCLCIIPVAATFRSGVCLYFIGMSAVGLLQPLLLRVPAFRKFFSFPDEVGSGPEAAKKLLKDEDELQARMTVQFPYFSHLLSPQVEENEDFIKRAPLPPRTIRSMPAGSNPLMRETPIRAGKTESHATPSTTPSAAKPKSSKGSQFASSGWKSASSQVSFSEDDFIPRYDDKNGKK